MVLYKKKLPQIALVGHSKTLFGVTFLVFVIL